MKAEQDFTTGNILKQIILFSLPMLAGNVLQQAYSIIDAIVVGRFIGGTAMGAVGVAMNISHFLIASIIGLTTGASVVLSQFFGAKKLEDMKKTVSTSIVFLGVLSVIIMIIGYMFAPSLLRLLQAPDEIFYDALVYLRILIIGIVFPIFYNMYTAYLRALGDSKSPLKILMWTTILNIILNLIVVILFGWGIAAVAWVTIFSKAVSAIWCYLHVKQSAPLLHVDKLSFDFSLFKLIIRYGFPAAIQLSFVSLATLSISRLINSFGSVATAAIVAASKVDSLAMMPLQNVSMAMSTFVAQNMGAGLMERAKLGLRYTLGIMLTMAVFVSALLITFGPWIISLFIDQSYDGRDAILSIASEYLAILVFFYFLFAVLFAFNGFFRGAGDAVVAMATPIISLTVRVLSAYLLVLGLGMGLSALAWSTPIGWAFSSLCSWIYYQKGWWQGKVAVQK